MVTHSRPASEGQHCPSDGAALRPASLQNEPTLPCQLRRHSGRCFLKRFAADRTRHPTPGPAASRTAPSRSGLLRASAAGRRRHELLQKTSAAAAENSRPGVSSARRSAARDDAPGSRERPSADTTRHAARHNTTRHDTERNDTERRTGRALDATQLTSCFIAARPAQPALLKIGPPARTVEPRREFSGPRHHSSPHIAVARRPRGVAARGGPPTGQA